MIERVKPWIDEERLLRFLGLVPDEHIVILEYSTHISRENTERIAKCRFIISEEGIEILRVAIYG